MPVQNAKRTQVNSILASEMRMISVETTLADRIGRQRISDVVDRFYDRIRIHETLSSPFQEIDHWSEHKERLAYFWWIALGGTKERFLNFEVVPKHWRAGFSGSLLQDWIALFREVVNSLVEPQLAELWLQKVSIIGERLLIANHSYEEKMALTKPDVSVQMS